jgi:hypothetical protein
VRASWRSGRERDTRVRQLCQRLEFGLLAVSQSGTVEIMVSSAATMPRRNHRRRSRIVEEHWRRWGEPMAGGGSRAPVMTAYRQQALACAAKVQAGFQRPRDLKPSIPDAPKILHRERLSGLNALPAEFMRSQRQARLRCRYGLNPMSKMLTAYRHMSKNLSRRLG